MQLVLFLLVALAGIKSTLGVAFSLSFFMSAKHLPKTDGFNGRLGDYFAVAKQRKGSKTVEILRSENSKFVFDPEWTVIGLCEYVDGRDNHMIYQVWDADHYNNQFVGSCEVEMGAVVNQCGRKVMSDYHPNCYSECELKGGFNRGLFYAKYKITGLYGLNNREDCGTGANQTTCGTSRTSSLTLNKMTLPYQILALVLVPLSYFL